MTELPPTDRKRCDALRKDGSPCQAPALTDDQFCWAHSSSTEERRDAARKSGGLNSAKAVRLRGLMPPRLVPVFDALEAALTEVHDGRLDPKQATAMAAIARAMVSVLTAGEIEQRVRDIEARSVGERRLASDAIA
jgi:hypothetical protein